MDIRCLQHFMLHLHCLSFQLKIIFSKIISLVDSPESSYTTFKLIVVVYVQFPDENDTDCS